MSWLSYEIKSLRDLLLSEDFGTNGEGFIAL